MAARAHRPGHGTGHGPAHHASRLLLLLLLVLGVTGMHTLGHATTHHAMADAGSHSVGVSAGHGPAVAGGLVAPGRDLPDLDPGAMCLAVLTSLLLLWIGTARLRAQRLALAVLRRSGPRLRPARPPPPGMALRLTRVTVLRT
ncbi:hypothetical protein [Spongiactinospora sp. TRM90649]|uniref:hypothetical protein n=1 Tax=Spongiactinospora sp. TRM90649 TaxID=3031114 RepID=UPI0023F7A7F3|nr:hypothetical protein [Spongiactinospora sp. TRM90649]MDF5753620.1 hypothetical protein [Spongiactinospora sp. TRM90649]